MESLIASVDRTVLVLGCTGVGKSTMINMLFHNSHLDDALNDPAPTGSSADSVTKRHSLYYCIKRKIVYFDTIGLGDPDLTTSGIISTLRALLTHSALGLNAIFLVMKYGRLSEADRMNIFLLRELFTKNVLKSHGVLVVTFYDGNIGEEAQYADRWVADSPYMKELFDSFSSVIFTNNSSGRSAYPEIRQRLVEDLDRFIVQRKERVFPNPQTFVDFVNSIVRHFVALFAKTKNKLSEILSAVAAVPSVRIYCGQCKLCERVIESHLDCCWLQCSHTFHAECLRKAIASGTPCKCGQPHQGIVWSWGPQPKLA